jgi:transposase
MDKGKLSAKERRRLTAVVQGTHDTRQFRRALAVLESDSGKSPGDVAQMLRVSRQSVYNWIEDFRRTGDVYALVDAPRSGRPVGFDERGQALLHSLLQSTPQHFGYFATQWTVPLLQEQLQHGMGQCYGQRTIRRGLHRLGYVWKRARYVLIPDPQREKKALHLPRCQWLGAAQRAAG